MIIKECPICSAKVIRKKVKETYTYKGKSITVNNLPIFHCTGCGEEFINEERVGPINKKLDALYREVEGLLQPQEIVEIRKKFGYSQEEFAEIVGGGPKAFAKYEKGTVTQSRSMDNLLRILRDSSDAMAILTNQKAICACEAKSAYQVKKDKSSSCSKTSRS